MDSMIEVSSLDNIIDLDGLDIVNFYRNWGSVNLPSDKQFQNLNAKIGWQYNCWRLSS